MELVAMRSIAGVGLAVSLGVGLFTGSRLTLDTEAAVETLMAKRITPEEAQRKALEREASYATSEALHQTVIDDAVREHGVPAPDRERLLAPNRYAHPASHAEPEIIAVGEAWTAEGLKVSVRTESIETERRGMRTKVEHTLADVENVGTTPLAYRIDIRAVGGGCQMRALTRFNAMALLPGESGEISICGGVREVEVRELEVLEVTPIGAHWISKIPALAVGYDDVIARSHFAGNGVEMCAEVPAAELARRIEAGEVGWADFIDFYSRHDCEHYRWFPGYQRAVEPLTTLPVSAPD